MQHYFDEYTQIHIAYEIYEGDVNVILHECFYEGTNDMPVPLDFDFKTKAQLTKHLEEIVVDGLYFDAEEEEAYEANYLRSLGY